MGAARRAERGEKVGDAAQQPPVRPVGRAVVDRRAEIVAKAAELFDARGYHHTSVEDIAAAAGIRKPSLYHYFKSKDELLVLINEEFVDHLEARQAARERLPLTESQRLLEVMGDVLELMETHRGHVRVVFEHHRELPPREREAIVRRRAIYRATVEEIVRRGIDAGEFRPVDVRLTTLALFGMCNWAYQWYRAEGPLRGREVAYVFSELLLNGLAATPAAAAEAPPADDAEPERASVPTV